MRSLDSLILPLHRFFERRDEKRVEPQAICAILLSHLVRRYDVANALAHFHPTPPPVTFRKDLAFIDPQALPILDRLVAVDLVRRSVGVRFRYRTPRRVREQHPLIA